MCKRPDGKSFGEVMTKVEIQCHVDALKRTRALALHHMYLAMDMIDEMLADAERLMCSVAGDEADDQ
jgi:hypothetical protein